MPSSPQCGGPGIAGQLCPVMSPYAPVLFEIIPHPRYRGEWLLKPTRGAPFGLWYQEWAHAVSYAEWVAREVDCAEIVVRNGDGTLAVRKVIERMAEPDVKYSC